MTRGRALHIGVRSYDATVYRREVPRVLSAEADAAALADLTFREGFIAAPPLLSAAATLAAVEDAFGQAQRDLAAGELFVVSFSGHGGRYADVFDDLTARPPGGTTAGATKTATASTRPGACSTASSSTIASASCSPASRLASRSWWCPIAATPGPCCAPR
jgi:hypothetical protein